MSKYAPLREYLKRQKLSDVILTFGEIEDIISALLPANSPGSAQCPLRANSRLWEIGDIVKMVEERDATQAAEK